jgi:hypothetical protein
MAINKTSVKKPTQKKKETNKEEPKTKLHLENLKKGSFHEWLGKKPDEPITDADIEKGLNSDDPHVRKQAQFAKNAKKWKHPKKESSNETISLEDISNYAATFPGGAPIYRDW